MQQRQQACTCGSWRIKLSPKSRLGNAQSKSKTLNISSRRAEVVVALDVMLVSILQAAPNSIGQKQQART